MKTLYIHVGTPKTGSSTIQRILWDNSELLEKHGILYPRIDVQYRNRNVVRNASFLIGSILDENGKTDYERMSDLRMQVLENIHSMFQNHDTIVISDEGLWHYTAKGDRFGIWPLLRDAAAENGYQIKVIVYFRKQIDYLASQWNQKVKVIHDALAEISWPEYLETLPGGRGNDLDYYKVLMDIAGYVGKENIIVRRFDRKYMVEGDATFDFLSLLGFEDFRSLEDANRWSNSSLQGNTHEIKRIANHYLVNNPLAEKETREALRNVSQISNAAYPAKIYTLEDEAEINEKTAESNRLVAEEFLRDGSPLFDDKKRVYTSWERENPQMDADIVAYVTNLNIRLVNRMEKMETEIQNLKKQIGLRSVIRNTVKSITGKKK